MGVARTVCPYIYHYGEVQRVQSSQVFPQYLSKPTIFSVLINIKYDKRAALTFELVITTRDTSHHLRLSGK